MTTTARLQDVHAAIEESPEGQSTAACFDVDGAVIAGRVAELFANERGRSRRGIGDITGLLGPFRPGGSHSTTAAIVRGWRGQEESRIDVLADRVFARKVAKLVYAEARELIDAHRRKGHLLVLTSSATRHQLRPLADALGVDAIVCSEAEVVDGRLTGNLVGSPCSGEAKAAAVKDLAAARGVELTHSHAYADGDDNEPLLSLVGVAWPTNPGRGLAAAAQGHKWPTLRFDTRGRSDAGSVARSLAAFGAMLPSMLGGVAVGVLNRDRNSIAQYGVSSWIERMFAITGVQLRVRGEEHLWSDRPAVFIYNHRNNFDPYIAIKLVHRDWGSVAKKEIAGPLYGLMQWLTPNVAYIDRSDAEKAVEGLRPVTDLLQRGVSILVAPEGTRSITGQLGRFKKGPFRMAMQANVPIVPIVIHNADRVADRDATVVRKGTVDVTVLPPVAVADWTPEDLDDRIAGVRELFLDTLAQPVTT